MKRREWAFLVSRIMAVLVLVRLIESLALVPYMVRLSSADKGFAERGQVIALSLAIGVMLLAELLVAAYLWYRAEAFAGLWGSTDEPMGDVGEVLRVVAFGGVGLYYFVGGCTQTVLLILVRFIPQLALSRHFAASDRWGTSVLSAVLGFILVLYSARPGAGLFGLFGPAGRGIGYWWRPYGRREEDDE